MSYQPEVLNAKIPAPPKDKDDILRYATELNAMMTDLLLQLNRQNLNFVNLRAPSVSTTNRDLSKVVPGLAIFNSTTAKLNFWDGSAWREVTST